MPRWLRKIFPPRKRPIGKSLNGQFNEKHNQILSAIDDLLNKKMRQPLIVEYLKKHFHLNHVAAIHYFEMGFIMHQRKQRRI